MKTLTILLFSLIHYNAICQFFGPIESDYFSGFTYNTTHGNGRILKKVKHELNQIAKLTNSKISYSYIDLDTTTVTWISGTMIKHETITLDTLCSYLKAQFSDGINAVYEVWFTHSFSSDSVKIKFESQSQYLNQLEEIRRTENYIQISSDSLISNSGKFWSKQNWKKMFGIEIITFNLSKMEIKVLFKYYNRRDYKISKKKLKILTKTSANRNDLLPNLGHL